MQDVVANTGNPVDRQAFTLHPGVSHLAAACRAVLTTPARHGPRMTTSLPTASHFMVEPQGVVQRPFERPWPDGLE